MTDNRVILEAGGVCRTADLIASGVTKQTIRRALDANLLVRVRQGIYCSDASHLAATAAQHGGTMACVSALRAHGVWVHDESSTLHVGISPRARNHWHEGCACVVHRSAFTAGLGITSVAIALVQVARCMGEEVFFAALESALNKRLLSSDERAWIRSNVTRRFAELVDFARSDAESGLESLVRLRLSRVGVSTRTQVRIEGVGRVDLVIGNLIVELDGRENHDGPSQRHKDLMRDANAAKAGWRVLRFDYAMVIYDWPLVRDTILAML